MGLAGYVSTGYGARPQADVIADIRAWYDQHSGQMSGIFLDEFAEKVRLSSSSLAQRRRAHALAGCQGLLPQPAVQACGDRPACGCLRSLKQSLDAVKHSLHITHCGTHLPSHSRS